MYKMKMAGFLLMILAGSVMSDAAGQVKLVGRIGRFAGVSRGEAVQIQSSFPMSRGFGLTSNPEPDEVENGSAVPGAFRLMQNCPNPFNPETVIRYDLPADSRVVIKIYQSHGQEVCTLIDERQSAGACSVIWSGRNRNGQPVPSGVYICRIRTASHTASMKMILLK